MQVQTLEHPIEPQLRREMVSRNDRQPQPQHAPASKYKLRQHIDHAVGRETKLKPIPIARRPIDG